MSPRILPIPLDSENILEQLIIADPGNLEDGLIVLDNQVAAGSGFIDILAVDASDKALIIIELKKDEADRMLVQTLQYYDFVRENAARFASTYRSKHAIDDQAEPRMILVAHSFSEALQAAAKYIEAPLALYRYEYLQLAEQKALYLTELPIAAPAEFKRRRRTMAEHIEHMASDELRVLCQDVIEKILALDATNIIAKGLRGRIVFKYFGRNLANVIPRQNYFYINWKGRWKERIKVEKADDIPPTMFDQIREVLKSLAGDQGTDDEDNDVPDDTE